MYSYVLRNAMIADGTGAPLYQADVCLEGGSIAAVCSHYEGVCSHEIDLTGLVLSPGFIDIHTHSDTVPLLTQMNPESKLYQGVTLEITGNCGISHLPLVPGKERALTEFYNAMLPSSVAYIDLVDHTIGEFAARVAQHPPAIHYGVLIGHGTLRGAVMGFDMRKPTPAEQQEMESLLDRELAGGAFGMSLGLIYPPSSYAGKDELIGLAKVLAARKRILSVHMRSESDGVFQAVEEMLEVAAQSGVHLEISHLKLMGQNQWGKTGQLLARLDQARKDGVHVTCDQYPYNAGSTGLSALVPGWGHAGGVTALVKRCAAPTQQLLEDIRAEMERRGGAGAVLIVDTHGNLPQLHGKTLDEIARMWDLSPQRAAAECLAKCQGSVSCIYFTMDMDDVCAIMKDPNISVGSDGSSFQYSVARECNFHPRNFGTFPRFLQTVRERQLMPLEKAVYKMTGLPSQVLGLKDRGRIAPGMAADLTVFHPMEVADQASYTDSARKPLGIPYVFVSGQPAVWQGVQTANRNGAVLLRKE